MFRYWLEQLNERWPRLKVDCPLCSGQGTCESGYLEPGYVCPNCNGKMQRTALKPWRWTWKRNY